MAQEILTTAEILALARKQGAMGGGGGSTESAPDDTPASEAAPTESQTADAGDTPPAARPAGGGAKPPSTSDILAAARAQGGGGTTATSSDAPAAKADKPAAPTGKPSSTADILAAARGQGAADAAKPAADASGGKPSSTADILAAARAGKGGGGASAPAKPAAGKTSPKAPPKTRPDGDKPSVQEMLKAVREGKPVAPPVDKAKAKPRLPSRKPKVPKGKSAKAAGVDDRRGFLAAMVAASFGIGFAILGLIGGVWTLYLARFMMPNVITELPTKFKIGPASDYPLGSVSTKWKPSRGIWVVHTTRYQDRNLIFALVSVCTHLGCTPSWLEGEQKFKCPCHGSGFYIDGINFEGPAPRPLERAGLRLSEDGSLEVDKSVKFQEELGQWNDDASFVEIT